MIDKRSIATDGYRPKNIGKKLFAIAVAGYIALSPSTEIITPLPKPGVVNWGGAGRGAYSVLDNVGDDFFSEESNERLRKLKQENLKREDEEIFLYIKMFLKCQS